MGCVTYPALSTMYLAYTTMDAKEMHGKRQSLFQKRVDALAPINKDVIDAQAMRSELDKDAFGSMLGFNY